MDTRRFLLAAVFFVLLPFVAFSAKKDYSLKSPDGDITVTVKNGGQLTYSVSHGKTVLLSDSRIGMRLSGGTVLGGGDKVRKTSTRSVDETLKPVIYKKAEVEDKFNELTLSFKEYDVIFRAYDDGVAYRFVAKKKGSFKVEEETAEFNFARDWNAWVPYANSSASTLEGQMSCSFENTYSRHTLSSWDKGKIAFLPVLVEAEDGLKVCITESDLLDYPGMFLYNGKGGRALSGMFAAYPKEVHQGGHNMLQGIVDSREDYIAKCSGNTSFPWRTMIISESDKELADNDMVWRLGTPSEGDYSWVRPGKVAWDWWNDWNIYGVDFRAGINNDTYKYYIDFASEHGIEYVILDEGWAVNLKADLMQVIPEIDVKMLADYASSKGVGLILWAGYLAFDKDMEKVCKHYASMGIKGFKVDFMDRDDQQILDFYVRAAKTAAKYHLMLDFHGAFKPAGIHRTYPNVVNFEGVWGLEQRKWDASGDQVTYDVTIPFIRMVAGPFDYTQGAMRNATRGNYRSVNSEAMSQGTRCRQLAEYVVFESPLNMMCDSPSNYMAEAECTEYISNVPTVWDETVAIDGEVGRHVAIARRSGDEWWVGALTDWDARDMVLNLDFLGKGNWKMEVFRDGVNADRAARDYKREVVDVPSNRKVQVHMAPGGGWTARISK